MSYSIRLRKYRRPRGRTGAPEDDDFFEAKSGTFSFPNRMMDTLFHAMSLVGLLEGEDHTAPPSEHGQVADSKFADHGGHIVTATECASIANGLAELVDDEDDLEVLYDVLSASDDDTESIDAFLHAWIAFNRLGARGHGYEVS